MPDPTVDLNLTLAERVIAAEIVKGIQNASIAEWDIIDNIIAVLGIKESDTELFGITTEETANGSILRFGNKDAALEEKPYALTTAQYEFLKRELKKRESRFTRNERSLAKKILA